MPITASGTLMSGQNNGPPVSPSTSAAIKNRITGSKQPPAAAPVKAYRPREPFLGRFICRLAGPAC